MSPLAWMTGLSGGSAAAAILAGAPAVEVLGGMLGPLAAANVTWVVAQRTFRRAPDRVMHVMLKAFAVKAAFFGIYVTAMVRGFELTALPFALSFAGFFVGVYVVEALFLQRLFAGAR